VLESEKWGRLTWNLYADKGNSFLSQFQLISSHLTRTYDVLKTWKQWICDQQG